MLFMLLTFILAWICAVILRYSLWRNECSKRMPGEKPRLFDILGDVKDLIVFHAPSGSNMIQKNFQDQFRRRTEKYKKQKLFCLWVTYVPFVVIFKHEAVKIIHERKERYLSGHIEQDRGKRKALLDRLLEMHMETEELSEEDIWEEVNTFVLAGHETVSSAIVWALYLIGLHCDVQEKIHDELDKVFGEDTKRPVTEKDLNELQYLDCVLKVDIFNRKELRALL
ncbi:cytochrome P450 4V2-like isoform X2 [Argiope bruennichi]|uniref:cytochrome P450 4V2-like isoform X2 n=1 Tax=Argiope bruennichi TaxID=94029 RepID=UPI00249532AF|nr:cytochrome P450 4V2-like isoform X2 [Argiope bruennichi]